METSLVGEALQHISKNKTLTKQCGSTYVISYKEHRVELCAWDEGDFWITCDDKEIPRKDLLPMSGVICIIRNMGLFCTKERCADEANCKICPTCKK